MKLNNDHYGHNCVLEIMLSFLNYPKSNANKQTLWKDIMDYVKVNNITNSYDIIIRHDTSQQLVIADNIIIIFGFDIKRVLNHVKTLKHHEKINDILIGLTDNNTIRILFENDDMYEIIFNNYKTINLELLENHHIPVDSTIKKIFEITSLSEINKKGNYPSSSFNEDQKLLLSKYIFIYLPNDKINKLIKQYKIAITNDHINNYMLNEYWTIGMFEHLIKCGAKPSVSTVICACEKRMDKERKNRWLFDLLRTTIDENKNDNQ